MERALADYDQVLQLEPQQVQTMHAKAQTLDSLGRADEAKSWAAAAEGTAALISGDAVEAVVADAAGGADADGRGG